MATNTKVIDLGDFTATATGSVVTMDNEPFFPRRPAVAVVMGTYTGTLKVQGSDDNSTWVDIVSLTDEVEYKEISLKKYMRADYSDSDGPGTFSVTRNGGTEWIPVSMVQQGSPLSGDIRILRGTVNVGSQTSGQDLRCRYQTEVGKDQFIHSWGLQGKL